MKKVVASAVIFLFVSNLFAQRLYGTREKSNLPAFDIPLSESTNPASVYFYQQVEQKCRSLDTSITAKQILSLTRYYTSMSAVDPAYLDSLASKAYAFNEEKKYQDAVRTADLLLKASPTNITGHKELSLAFKRMENDSLSAIHFAFMVKIIKAVLAYGDGTYEYPFIINNFFEGLSIYEAAFYCKPNKMVLMLDKQKRLVGAYNGYSARYDEILIRYADLSHWKPRLKKGDYIEEQ